MKNPLHIDTFPTRRCLLWVVVILAYGMSSFLVLAQGRSRAVLERQKQEILKRIATAERILSSTRNQKKTTIAQLSILNKQIEDHQALIETYSQTLHYIKDEISETSQVVLALQQDLNTMRIEYGQMVLWAYKNRLGINHLTFLFSSDSFRQLFLRMKYLAHYAEYRRIQLEAIQKVKRTLDLQNKDLNNSRNRQEQLLKQQQRRSLKLLALREERQKAIARLENRRVALRRELREETAALARMERLIRKAIERAATARPSASSALLTTRFEKNRGHLRWPVRSGVIASRFGRQPHPVFGIMQNNTGIEIQTDGPPLVRAVFEGTVSQIARVPGMNHVVILEHGKYRTVYARLANVKVTKGQQVRAEEVIGVSYTTPQGITALRFEIWRDFEKQNPERWLQRQ